MRISLPGYGIPLSKRSHRSDPGFCTRAEMLEQHGLLGSKEGGATVVVTTAARLWKDPTSWTQQQGKADAISGRTIRLQNLKRK